MTQLTMTSPLATLSGIRSTSTGAFVTLILFAICWGTAAIGMTASHNFIGLFTQQPPESTTALLNGGVYAFVTGGVAGFLIAHCYNLAGRMFGD